MVLISHELHRSVLEYIKFIMYSLDLDDFLKLDIFLLLNILKRFFDSQQKYGQRKCRVLGKSFYRGTTLAWSEGIYLPNKI